MEFDNIAPINDLIFLFFTPIPTDYVFWGKVTDSHVREKVGTTQITLIER